MNQSGFHGRNVTGTARHCGLELPKWIVWVPIFPGKSVFSLLRLSDTFKDDILVGLGFFVVWVVVFCFKIVCSGNDPILRSMFFRWVVSSPTRCFFSVQIVSNPMKWVVYHQLHRMKLCHHLRVGINVCISTCSNHFCYRKTQIAWFLSKSPSSLVPFDLTVKKHVQHPKYEVINHRVTLPEISQSGKIHQRSDVVSARWTSLSWQIFGNVPFKYL